MQLRVIRQLTQLALILLVSVSCSSTETPVHAELVITGGMIVDTDAGSISAPSDVLIMDGKVVDVVEATNADYPDIEKIDASGLYLLPGLIDVHAHIGSGGLGSDSLQDRKDALTQFLSYGVTSIFVPGGGGGNDAQLAEWKAYCGSNPGLCPRVYGSGAIITAYGSHPITTIWGFPPDVDPARARERGAVGIKEADSVDELIAGKLAAGVDALKIVVEDGPGGFAPKPRLSKEKVADICKQAHANGLRVFAHVSLAAHVDDVVDAGCDGIMHAPDDLISEQTLQKMADQKMYYVATLSLFDALMDQEADRRIQEDYAIAGVSQKALQSLQADEYWAVDRESPELIAEWQEALRRNMQRANELGVFIALGTDTNNPQIFPGYSVHEELVLMTETGLSAAEALKAATATAAGFLEVNDLGSIKPGYRADIVVLRKNPLDDIRNTRTIEQVLSAGSTIDKLISVPEL